MTTCSHGVGVWDICSACKYEEYKEPERDARVEDIRRCLRLHVSHCRATGRYTNEHGCFGQRSTT